MSAAEARTGEPDIAGRDISSRPPGPQPRDLGAVVFSNERILIGTEESGIFSQEDIAEMKTRGIEVEAIGFGVALFQRLRLVNPNRVDI